MSTLAERIATAESAVAKAQALVDGLKAIEARAASLSSLAKDSVVKFVFGRKENRKEYTGTVLHVKTEGDNFDSAKVLAGEGEDTTIFTIRAGDILEVVATTVAE